MSKPFRKTVGLRPRARGFHLVTDEVLQAVPELRSISCGFLHVFIRHTSASLTINENADPDVRHDFEAHFNKMVPEDQPYYRHTFEGSDDMPAHIKGAMLGFEITLPVTDGRLDVGTWQGIYLCEHPDRASSRTLVVTGWNV